MTTVVVGAGLAGLVAASDLTRAGREVVVVEARERVGGRMLGIEVAKSTVARYMDRGQPSSWLVQARGIMLLALAFALRAARVALALTIYGTPRVSAAAGASARWCMREPHAEPW